MSDKSKCVTVGQLVATLTGRTEKEVAKFCKFLHPSMPIVVSSDPEGNDFHPLDHPYETGDWDPARTELRSEGGDTDEVAPGCVRVLVLWPGYGKIEEWQK